MPVGQSARAQMALAEFPFAYRAVTGSLANVDLQSLPAHRIWLRGLARGFASVLS